MKRYPVDFQELKLIYRKFNFVISLTERKEELHKLAEIQKC